MSRSIHALWWGGWTLVGALVVFAATNLATAWGLPSGFAALVAAAGAALAAAGFAWVWTERLSGDARRARRHWQQRYQARLTRLRSQVKALQQERQRLQRDLDRTQKAVRKAQREASQALARAQKAEQQAQHWRTQAQHYQQQTAHLAQQVAELEAARQRAERVKGLLEAVHRLEALDLLPAMPSEAAASPDTLFQRLHDAIQRLQEDRETALGLAREAEDKWQASQAHLAALRAEIEAYRARLNTCERDKQAAQARWRHLLHDLLAPQKDIVAVPLERWQTIEAYSDQRRAWDALLEKLQQPSLRAGQTKTLPGGYGGFIFPRGRQTRRLLFFEQPLHKRVLWVCRLWDAHEDDREYDRLTKQGAPRAELCPEAEAFIYWTSAREP